MKLVPVDKSEILNADQGVILINQLFQALINSDHEVAAVITRQDAELGRKRVLTPSPVAVVAAANGIPLIKANRLDETATEAVRALQPDLGVIVAYGGLVREPLLSVPRLGWINLHFSLLPRWRGAAPVQHAVIAGEQETGAAVFQLVPALDAGPVFGMIHERIGADQTAGELLESLGVSGAELLLRVPPVCPNNRCSQASSTSIVWNRYSPAPSGRMPITPKV